MTNLLLFLGAMGCNGTQDPEPSPLALLASDSAEERLLGFFLMDRQQMSDNVDVLLRVASDDPSEDVRREVVRQLGYCGDEKVVPFLRLALTTEMAEEAAESLGYLGPAGCAILAHEWVNTQDGDAPALGGSERAVRFALTITNPECLTSVCSLQDAHPRAVARLPGVRERCSWLARSEAIPGAPPPEPPDHGP